MRVIDDVVFLTPGTYSLVLGESLRDGALVSYYTYEANHWVVVREGNVFPWLDIPADIKWVGTKGRLEVFQDTQGIPIYRD